MLAHIVFKSRCTSDTSPQEMQALRPQFDEKNRQIGMLLCDGVYLLQVLEGISRRITSVESLLRGRRSEPLDEVLNRYSGHERCFF